MRGEPITVDDRPSVAYVMVTPGLVRKVGAVRALVWARIDWRTNEKSFAAVDPDGDGVRWWTADLETIADETGLTFAQVKNAVLELERQGHLESRKFDARKWGHKKSYRTVIMELDPVPPPSEKPRDSAYSETGKSIVRNGKIIPIKRLEELKEIKLHLSMQRHRSDKPASEAQVRFLRDCHLMLHMENPPDEVMAEYRAMSSAEAHAEIRAFWAEIEHGGSGLLEEARNEFGAELSPQALAHIQARTG